MSILALSALLLGVLFSLLTPTHEKKSIIIEPLSIPGRNFIPIVFGNGGYENGSSIITELDESHNPSLAVLRAKIEFHATDYSFLKYRIEGRQPGLKTFLYWRRRDNPQQTYFQELNFSDKEEAHYFLSRNDDWIGEIVEIAVGFSGDIRDGYLALHELELEPFTYQLLMKTIWDEWSTFNVWKPSSINNIQAGSKNSIISPVLAIGIVFCLSVLLLLIYSRFFNLRLSTSIRTVVASGLICWVFLDFFWQRRLNLQLEETKYLFASRPMHERKLSDIDGELYRSIAEIKSTLLPAPGPTIWIVTENRNSYLGLRSRYHLTPHQTIYQKDAFNTYWAMNRFGFAKANEYLLAIGRIKRLHYSKQKKLLSFFSHCTIADVVYTNSTLTLYKLTREFSKCKEE